MRRLFSFLAVFAFLAMTNAHGQEPMRLPVHQEPLVAKTAGGDKSFSIEIADEPRERSRGLMFRRNMPNNHGMLFLFDNSTRRSFWMQNTPMALDLLFVGEDGRVRAIEQGEPLSTAAISPPVNAQFVLELKAGTAQKTGITVGTRLDHPMIGGAAEAD